jgi:branched-chain amino acid transport system ATP-binding protein
MPLLHVDGLSKRFGGLDAVSNLSFSVEAGHITGLIGPNGAGKTTVVNLITGLLAATQGKILLNGQDVTKHTAYQLARVGVARTFQNIRLLNGASVLDNVIVGFHRHEKSSLLANLLGLPKARRELRDFREQARQLLARFDMTRYQHYPAGALSYGHQRRVEMMRALAVQPSLLLLDEPVAGMNDGEAHELGEIFEGLARDGIGILLIEHNMRFVMTHCRHLYVVNTGKLIASGPPEVVSQDAAVIKAYLWDEDA